MFVCEQIIALPVFEVPVAPGGEQNAPGVTKSCTVDCDADVAGEAVVGAAVVGAAVVGGGVVGGAVVDVETRAAVVALVDAFADSPTVPDAAVVKLADLTVAAVAVVERAPLVLVVVLRLVSG